jgi:hypothetical protein
MIGLKQKFSFSYFRENFAKIYFRFSRKNHTKITKIFAKMKIEAKIFAKTKILPTAIVSMPLNFQSWCFYSKEVLYTQNHLSFFMGG